MSDPTNQLLANSFLLYTDVLYLCTELAGEMPDEGPINVEVRLWEMTQRYRASFQALAPSPYRFWTREEIAMYFVALGVPASSLTRSEVTEGSSSTFTPSKDE